MMRYMFAMHDADDYGKQALRVPSVPQTYVDLFLYLEGKERNQLQELETYRRRLQGKRERMETRQEELNRNLDEVEILAARQDECDSEKKRLWDVMSNEDLREVGRRDIHNKRHKVH
jgi:hypothetical protein